MCEELDNFIFLIYRKQRRDELKKKKVLLIETRKQLDSEIKYADILAGLSQELIISQIVTQDRPMLEQTIENTI